MAALLHVAVLLLSPALLLAASQRVKVLGAIGPTVLSYSAGILWGNFGLAPADHALSLNVAQATVPLAIPLLLFATDFVRWLRLARSTVISFALAVAGVLVAAAAGAFLFARQIPEGWKVAGMLVGVYTGGTANLTAIGVALEASQETFILTNAADMVVGAVYLLFLMSVAQRVLLKVLPPFRTQGGQAAAEAAAAVQAPAASVAGRFLEPAMAVGLSAAVVAASAGVALLVTGKLSDALVILSITTLGIGLSFFPRVRALRGAYDTGQYLLLIFCVAIGSTADFRNLATAPAYLYYVAFVVATAVLIHVALAALLRIDADTVIITSAAGVFSPPFVGPVAAAIKNPEVVVSGLTTGVVGYAVGNYLGIGLAYLFRP